MNVEVDVTVRGVPATCAVVWEWENVEGLTMIGLGDPEKPPRVEL